MQNLGKRNVQTINVPKKQMAEGLWDPQQSHTCTSAVPSENCTQIPAPTEQAEGVLVSVSREVHSGRSVG